MEKFVIIDGNSLINRAFYGLPMLKSLKGEPCNAVYGFINIVLNLIQNEKPKYLVCVFDAGKHTFRHNMYEAYKGTRDKMPEDLASQLPILKDLLHAMSIKTLEKAEIEADDIIGTLTRKFNEEFILISGDKDLLQLINNNTTVWLTQKGISNVLKVDENVLKQEFNLKPYQVIELKSIMGDSSDNIPGVAGIGKIGAGKLIEEYDNLDNIYKNIDNIAGKLKEKLEINKEMAYLSKQLATIKLDVDLDVLLNDCEYYVPFSSVVKQKMQDLDFKSLIAKKDLFEEATEEQVIENTTVEIVEIENQTQFNEMVSNLNSFFAISSCQFSFNFSTNDKEYVLYKNSEIFTNNYLILADIFCGETEKIVFDAKQLMHDLADSNLILNNYFDASIAMYIANQSDAEISLEDALKLNGINTNSFTNALLKLKEIYLEKLKQNNQYDLYLNIELPLVEVLYNMEKFGFKVDKSQIESLSEIYSQELKELTSIIHNLAGVEFNIKSPKQLHEVLFDKLQIEYKGKKGTSVEVLKAIENKHEIVKYIIRYRKIAKITSTYLDGMLNCISSDGKIHTTFMQKITATGRLSSREPNLQNLPIRDDEFKKLRKMFSSSFENGKLVSADYNQIELRLIANFSEDENMINDYLSGADIHTATASKIFNVDIKDVTSSMRRVAKSVNFGIIYGISAFGLSENIKSTPKQASEFIKKYMEAYPLVKEYGEKCVEFAKTNGYAKTLMGRVRHIDEINSANHVIRSFGERVAKNMPLQGSASDIIKIAMIKVYNRLKNENLKSKLILQIHDELIVDCVAEEVENVKKILKEEMESVVNLRVPLLVEVSSGKTLLEAK